MSTALATRPTQVALVGSPNAGKTSLFNALTGIRAKTANYPGVTVSRREAPIEVDGRPMVIADLPGTYGLEPISPDEAVVADALRGRIDGIDAPDALIVVADATSLERSLFLVAEVLDLGMPTCLVLTMIDEVATRGGHVDTDHLAAALGIPVVGIVGHRGIGLDQVHRLLADIDAWSAPVIGPPAEPEARAAWVDSVARSAAGPLRPDERTRRVDAVLLHKVWGVVVFVVVMLVFFQAIFTLAAPVVDLLGNWVTSASEFARSHLPGLLGGFVADAVIGGVGAVIAFIPQIAILFFILGLLERVGYLARAALLADRLMGRFGLEGRSFVSMLSSFACAVPGIMSTRGIPNERQRIATMMAAPLMTCSARLPVFTLLIGAFVPNRSVLGPLHTQGLVLFGLYALGAVSGLAYAAVVSRFALAGPTAPFLMELPPYRWPTAKAVALHMWEGVWSFLRKAGTIILAATVVLWAMTTLPRATHDVGATPEQRAAHQIEQSAAGRLGKAVEPVFAPLGFDWRTNVAVIGSLAAREVFVSTLAVTTASDERALPERLQTLRHADGRPVYDAPTVAALLVFFVYALQCLSTVAVLHRESNSWKWPALAMGSMFALAYGAALVAHTIVGAIT
ncbi:MAG: ferrous iron transporter B [Actinobacteria bacterium]|nr:ferrous iron transporter B [Actinomycetota bacterium]